MHRNKYRPIEEKEKALLENVQRSSNTIFVIVEKEKKCGYEYTSIIRFYAQRKDLESIK